MSLTGWVRRYASIALKSGCIPFSPVPRFTERDGQPFHHRLDLLEGKTIRSRRIAITESTGEIALVCESEPERDSVTRAPEG